MQMVVGGEYVAAKLGIATATDASNVTASFAYEDDSRAHVPGVKPGFPKSSKLP